MLQERTGNQTNHMAYDKAKWHYGGDFPADLPEEQAFVHTGMFLGWLIDRNLVSDQFHKDFADEIEKFHKRETSGPRIFQLCDGVFDEEMLSEPGNQFTREYYGNNDGGYGQFLEDYDELLADDLDSTYHVEDTLDNYNMLKDQIDLRYAEWSKERK
jgi:hypothetical protein